MAASHPAGTTPYYFIPSPSRFPAQTALGMFFVILGAGQWINGAGWGAYSLLLGVLIWLFTLYQWFGQAIRESESGLSPATGRALSEIEALGSAIRSTDWAALLQSGTGGSAKRRIQAHSESLLASLLALHTTISDSFLNHQILMHGGTRPLFAN